jgi:uncharacterized protein
MSVVLDVPVSSSKVNPNWRKVSAFLALTFGLTWILDLLLWRSGGTQNPALTLLTLQLQMLLPAFSAILLQLFIFREYTAVSGNTFTKPRLFLLSFMVMTAAYACLVGWAMLEPEQAVAASGIAAGLNLLLFVVLAGLRFASSREEFTRAGLAGGRLFQWLVWGGCLVVFYALTVLLNGLFKLGERADLADLLQSLNIPGQVSIPAFLILVFVQTVIAGPLLGLIMAFGEEYGWRGFLQGELFRMGRIRGVLLLGLIWGVWHYPVVWMGHTYPGQPVLGSLMISVFTLLFGIFLSYAMLKTGAIWLVAFLHAVNNQVLSYFNSFIYEVADPLISFNTGYLLILLALPVVALILRDPVWRKSNHLDHTLAQAAEPSINVETKNGERNG